MSTGMHVNNIYHKILVLEIIFFSHVKKDILIPTPNDHDFDKIKLRLSGVAFIKVTSFLGKLQLFLLIYLCKNLTLPLHCASTLPTKIVILTDIKLNLTLNLRMFY